MLIYLIHGISDRNEAIGFVNSLFVRLLEVFVSLNYCINLRSVYLLIHDTRLQVTFHTFFICVKNVINR